MDYEQRDRRRGYDDRSLKFLSGRKFETSLLLRNLITLETIWSQKIIAIPRKKKGRVSRESIKGGDGICRRARRLDSASWLKRRLCSTSGASKAAQSPT